VSDSDFGAIVAPTPEEHPVKPWLPTESLATFRDRQRSLTWRGRVGALWARRGLWLGTLAIGLSFTCTLLLAQDEPVRTRAWIGLIVAGLLALVAWERMHWFPAFGIHAHWWPLERLSVRRLLCLLGIGVSVTLIWLANAHFASHQYEQFGLAGWLWLGSMALIIVSTWAWPLPGQKRRWPVGGRVKGHVASKAYSGHSMDLTSTLTVPPISPAITSLPVRKHAPPVRPVRGGRTIRNESGEREPPSWRLWEVALFLGIVALATGLRVWDLTTYPFAIHPDEIITGRIGSDFFSSDVNGSVFRTVWPNIDLPDLWFAFVGQSLKLGGNTLASLRLPAALFGAACVVPFYFLLRGIWGRAAAIAGSAIMAFGAASVHFGRITINNVVTPFFWTSCFVFLLRALRRGRPVDWVLAGIFGGLSEHFYYGTRLLPVVLVCFALYLLVIHWRRAKGFIFSFPLVAIGYMAALGPLFTWFTLNPMLYFGLKPGAKPLTWNHIPVSLDDLRNMWDTLWPLFARNLLAMSTLTATDAFYFGSMLTVAEAALLVLGVALLIWRWRHPAAFLLLISGLGVLVAGSTLVPDAANINHWTPGFPAIYAAVALPVGALAWASGRFLSRRLQYVAAGLMGIELVLLGWLNISYYFTQYQSYRADMDIPGAKARFQLQIGTTYRVRGVGRTWQMYDPETTGYLIKGIDGAQIMNPASELPLPDVPGKGLAFTFFNDEIQYLNVVQEMYPGGTHGQMNGQNGTLIFDYYLVSPELAGQAYGVMLQVFAPGAEQPGGTERTSNFGVIPGGVSYPVRARWTALLYVPANEQISLRVVGASATLLLDGQDTLPGSSHQVQQGWHQVTADSTLSGPAQLKLMLAENGGEAVEVARERLWPVLPDSGLLGSVASADGTGTVVRNERYIGFTDLLSWQDASPQGGTGLPLNARWTGELHAPVAGTYQIVARTNGQLRLSIDGKTEVGTCPSNDVASVAFFITLSEGWHPIQLDYMAQGSGHTLELYWTIPNRQQTLIPPTAFRFAPEIAFGPTAAPMPPENWNCAAP
jgi:4-amino-4-deoxy-L-arabinose transferase-like glycosyltransferase